MKWGRLLACIAVGCIGCSDNLGMESGAPKGAEVARSQLARRVAPPLMEADQGTFGADNRGFALALYHELAAEPGNLIFSPYSISAALAMTYAGARADTAREMETALRYSLGQQRVHQAFNATAQALAGRKDEGEKLDPMEDFGQEGELIVVNQTWGRKGYRFLSSYLDLLAQDYGAGMFLVDFGATEPTRTLINDWVAEQTHARIQDVLPPGAISADSALVLTNALYFKWNWLTAFAPTATLPGVFHAEAGDQSAPMMHLARLQLRYGELSGFKMLQLDYNTRSLQMLLVLPPPGPLRQVAKDFDAQAFDALYKSLEIRDVTMSMPKGRFESERKLRAPLQALGMRAAFDLARADLSGMDGRAGLYVDQVYHKAFIVVDEEGTEAAAASSTVIQLKSAFARVEVNFDRPFLFFIYDEPTGQALFLGHVEHID